MNEYVCVCICMNVCVSVCVYVLRTPVICLVSEVEEAWNVPYTGHLVIIGDSKWEGKVLMGQGPKQNSKYK